MNQTKEDNSWKSHLPGAFPWLEKVEIKQTSQIPPTAAHFVVCLKDEKNTDPAFSINAPSLPDTIRDALSGQLKLMGHRKAPELQTLVHDTHTYTLVQQSCLKVSNYRRGRQAGLDASRAFKSRQCRELILCEAEGVETKGLLEGFALGLYDLSAFRGAVDKSGGNLPEKLTLLGSGCSEADIEECRSLVLSSYFTRMIADAPPNWLNPAMFAELAEGMAQSNQLSCTIKTREGLEKLGMGAFLSVGNGSACEPHLIELCIDGKSSDKTLVLIGKGLTFDAGGVSLKPSQGMEEMKYDLCGGAAVLGAAFYLSRHKPPFNVVCLIGAVENLVDSRATRPGDIVKAFNGKTIEVLNTDAEGRLVLADLLAYARKTWSPAMMINAATLTGSVLHALGACGCGFMSNNPGLSSFLKGIAEEAGDPVWEMPLWPELAKEIRSEIADLKNIASPSVKAGALIGGVFLREFVKDTPWAHFDIAGTGWNCKATGFPGSGGSGFLLHTLVRACHSFKEPFKKQ